MPINSAFKRSLLNCQPIMSASSRVVSTAFDKTDGYSGVATGFASLIERQNGLNPRTIDSITLAGVSDFEGSKTFSVDPQRPEIILISKLFEGDRNINQKLLNLRDFESSIDEADIKTIFDEILSVDRTKEALDKRIELDYQNKDKLKKILGSLSQLVFSIDNFRDSIDFIGSNKKIHEVAISNKSKIQLEFSEDPTGSSMSFKRTFLGLDDVSLVSNTSLIQALLISLLLPGNIKFSNQNITNIQGSKFLLPSIQYDSTGDFLQFLASKDIVDQNDFFEVESRLPKDAYARLALLSDSLSYELVTTAGLKKIERQSVFEILKNDINPVVDIIRAQPQTDTIVSNLKTNDSLPFEIRKNTVDGVVYNGVLESFIDPVISNASLDFRDLEGFSKNVSSTLGSYLSSIEVIRGIKTNINDNLKGYKLITKACEYINRGSSSILSNTRVSAQGLQLALLIETSKNNTSNGIRARHSIFEKILTDTSFESNIVDRIRPRASLDTSKPVGSSSFLMNSKAFKNLLNQNSNDRPRPSQSSSNSSSSDGGIISSLLNNARETARRSASSSTRDKQVKPQIIAATNIASNLLNNKIIKNKKNESKNTFSKIEKNIKEEINPSNVFVRETVKDILGTLALAINTNIFSTSKNSQYNESDEEVNDLLTLKDSKIEEIGTSYATLEKFGIFLQDIYSRKNNPKTLASSNPVIDISKSIPVRAPMSREKDKIRDKINKINLLTLGSLPIKKKRQIKLEKISVQNANVNSYITSNQSNFAGFNSSSNQKKSPVQKREKKSETKISASSKTAQATSTLYTNLKNKPQINDSLVTASVLFGTSLKQDVVKEHFRLISANVGKKPIVSPVTRLEEIDPRTIDKIDTIDELFDLVNSVKLLESSGENKNSIKQNVRTNLRKINLDFSASKKKSLSLSEGFNPINSINPKFSSFFNILLDGTNDNTNSLIFNSDINAVLNQINSKNTVTEKIEDFYDEISSTIDAYVGAKDVLESYTSNYQLDEAKIKFIIFQMFMSILSLLQSTRMVRINSTYNSTNGFKIQSRISQTALKIELDALSSLANSSGSSSDIAVSGGITTNFSKVIKAISYCSISNDLVLERYSVAKSFLDIYTTSVNSLISASKSQEIIETLNILSKLGNVELLKNLTQEYISSKQLLYSKVVDEAVSIKSTTRQVRIAKNILPNILRGNNEDIDVLAVGLPIKSIETLRRIDVKTNTNISLAGKEYIELEFSKRNVQFADMIPKSSKIRFSPRLEVIPQFSDSFNLSSQIEDFIYLCYDESYWKPKNLNEAINFINKITGLSHIESTVLVMNHVLDAICKLFFNSMVGFSFDEFLIGRKLGNISKEGYEFLNLLLSDENVSKVIPLGDMSINDCIEKNNNIYNVKSFSKLGKDTIDRTDQSTHRLLNLFLSDASFNVEGLIKQFIETNPFERVYCCVLNQDDYIFDKISSYSTKSGRTIVDGLLREKIISQEEEEIKFIEDNFTRRLDADEISVRINLVSN